MYGKASRVETMYRICDSFAHRRSGVTLPREGGIPAEHGIRDSAVGCPWKWAKQGVPQFTGQLPRQGMESTGRLPRMQGEHDRPRAQRCPLYFSPHFSYKSSLAQLPLAS